MAATRNDFLKENMVDSSMGQRERRRCTQSLRRAATIVLASRNRFQQSHTFDKLDADWLGARLPHMAHRDILRCRTNLPAIGAKRT